MSTPPRERYGPLPSALVANTVWTTLCDNIPVMLIHPDRATEKPAPVLLWMHGRTVQKEIDPGRYLRLMRAGIAVCAIDLPGHGERYNKNLVDGYGIITQMVNEIDGIITELQQLQEFSTDRLGIGGMSAGGMATLARLCKPHKFKCASVEATTGSWLIHLKTKNISDGARQKITALNPLDHLENWQEIPLQAFHSKKDEWVSIHGQQEFLDALKTRYANPKSVEFITYEETGAPYEHMGFGRHAADAKNQQRDFFQKHLLD